MKRVIFTMILNLGLLSITSCKTPPVEKRHNECYNVLLEKGETGESIGYRFKDFSMIEVKKSSRSQNQYKVCFYLSNEEIITVEKVMSEDRSILKYSIITVRDIEVKSSTNVKKN